ncbi:hypothetical protein HKX48_003674 [Thoreauomyces humboldtii]|nr:hypothetical protein HKX48_003674 [Thoreauomyces humboldtii]
MSETRQATQASSAPPAPEAEITSPTTAGDDVDEQDQQQSTGTKAQANKDMRNVDAGFNDDDAVDPKNLGKAMNFLNDVTEKQKAQKTTEADDAGVVIGKEDVELLMSEFQLTKGEAEKALRAQKGDVLTTLRGLVAVA